MIRIMRRSLCGHDAPREMEQFPGRNFFDALTICLHVEFARQTAESSIKHQLRFWLEPKLENKLVINITQAKAAPKFAAQ